MTLRRYRKVDDMPPPPPAGSALDGLAAACALSEASAVFGHTMRAPRGIRRFSSVQEADDHRRRWESGHHPDRGQGPSRAEPT